LLLSVPEPLGRAVGRLFWLLRRLLAAIFAL
jgi:hypothetical protein